MVSGYHADRVVLGVECFIVSATEEDVDQPLDGVREVLDAHGIPYTDDLTGISVQMRGWAVCIEDTGHWYIIDTSGG